MLDDLLSVYAVTGAQLLLLMDIGEATNLCPPPDKLMLLTDLIAGQAIVQQQCQLEIDHLQSKVYSQWLKNAHQQMMQGYDFKPGNLVLMTQIKENLSQKMQVRYLRPLVLISRNRGGSQILAKMDGTVFDCLTAQFWLVPYSASKFITPKTLGFIHSKSTMSRVRGFFRVQTGQLHK